MDVRLTVARSLDRLARIVGPSDLNRHRVEESTSTSASDSTETSTDDSSQVAQGELPPRASLLLYSHRKAFTRLQELHDRALDIPDWDPTVVAEELRVESAPAAYSRSLGAALGSLAVATPSGRQAITEELTNHVLEVGSLRGLEGLVLSCLAATIESRRDAYDNLRNAAKDLGFDGPVGAGTGGTGFMDVRNGSISFVGEAAIRESFDVIDSIVGKPGEEPPFMGGPPGAQSSDPDLVGMSKENAEMVGTAASIVVGVGVSVLFAAAAFGTAGTAAPIAFAVSTALIGEAAALFTEILVTHIAEDPPPPADDGEEKPKGNDSTIMPNPADDGVPVFDVDYMNTIIEMHKPRTSDDGSSGRSFWTEGEFLVNPVDLVTDPPLEEQRYSLEYPVDLDALINSRKRPVNPNTGASVDYKGDGEAPNMIVSYGAVAMPFAGEERAPRIPLP
jgi:hypothetical protein